MKTRYTTYVDRKLLKEVQKIIKERCGISFTAWLHLTMLQVKKNSDKIELMLLLIALGIIVGNYGTTHVSFALMQV